jgi:hypothetical protein
VCGGLQNSVDLGETVPSVCSETHLTHSADESEVGNIRGEEDSQMQEEEEVDRLAVPLLTVKDAGEVCYN